MIIHSSTHKKCFYDTDFKLIVDNKWQQRLVVRIQAGRTDMLMAKISDNFHRNKRKCNHKGLVTAAGLSELHLPETTYCNITTNNHPASTERLL